MSTTVTLEPDALPDVTATLHDDGDYEVSITGLTGLEDRTIDVLTPAERFYYQQRGILELNPPTVRLPASELRFMDLRILEALEKVLPEGLLDNVEGYGPSLDKEHLLCAHVVRTVRLALNALETPE